MKLETNTRVTVKLDQDDWTNEKFYTGKATFSREAREETGLYWGYQI